MPRPAALGGGGAADEGRRALQAWGTPSKPGPQPPPRGTGSASARTAQHAAARSRRHRTQRPAVATPRQGQTAKAPKRALSVEGKAGTAASVPVYRALAPEPEPVQAKSAKKARSPRALQSQKNFNKLRLFRKAARKVTVISNLTKEAKVDTGASCAHCTHAPRLDRYALCNARGTAQLHARAWLARRREARHCDTSSTGRTGAGRTQDAGQVHQG